MYPKIVIIYILVSKVSKNRYYFLSIINPISKSKCWSSRIKSVAPNSCTCRYIYDYEVVINESKGHQATLINAYDGKKIFAEVYITSYETKDVPRDTDEAAAQFLMNIYKEKDKVKDYYLKHGHFEAKPGYKTVTVSPKYACLINVIVSVILVWSTLIWLCCSMIQDGSYNQMVLFAFCLLVIHFIQIKTLEQSQIQSKSKTFLKSKMS